VIPEDAVEAAAKVMQAQDSREGVGDYPLSEYTEDATAILEAAAPHMLAEWEEARKREAFDTLRMIDEQIRTTT